MKHTEQKIQRRDLLAAPRAAFSDNALLSRLYAARVTRPESLDYHFFGALPSPKGIPGMAEGAERLARAVLHGERVCISGDYDADGATASALCVRALRAFGLKAEYFVPDRATMGYGLTPKSFATLCARGKPDLIVTVDNGISSLAGTTCAKEAGVDLIVTDHHLPGAQLPDWGTLVNPNLEQNSSYRALAGVGVAFFLMLATRSVLRGRGHFRSRPEPALTDLLELVALGTVADVVPLDHLNRTLVEQGLRRLRAGRASAGVSALAKVADRDLDTLVASDFGFGLAPRLNAAGRMENMGIGIECLLSETPEAAEKAARQLNEINQARKDRQASMRAEAEEMITRIDMTAGGTGSVGALCLYAEDWHEGIVGLIASRIKDRIHRPVAAFAMGVNGLVKGSVRSVPGIHIRDVLALVDARHPGMIGTFGGHAMAAGLSLSGDRVDEFGEVFAQAAVELAAPGAFTQTLMTDGELAPEEITLDNARLIRYAGPWGPGFPEPVFDGLFEFFEVRPMGDGRHFRLRGCVQGTDTRIEAVAFDVGSMSFLPGLGVRRLVYHLDVNRFRGRDSLQIRVEDCVDPRVHPVLGASGSGCTFGENSSGPGVYQEPH